MQTNQLSKLAIVFTSLLTIPITSHAKPWLDTGNMRLRHELQLLSDADLLDVPLTTWPLSSEDIKSHLKQPLNSVDYTYQQAINDINKQLSIQDFSVSGNFRSKELLVRDFSGDGKEKSILSYQGDWSTPKINVRLNASIADKSAHPSDRTFRLDESYISTSLKKWRFTAGLQSRWWGPSWDGSLILSNNARPIPSLSFENIKSNPFKSKYLRWLGPTKLHLFIGQLESKRAVPNTKLIGARFTFKPSRSLEIGLHRSIQWGGKGQDNSFSDFIKTIISKRYTPKENQRIGSVRGNQIAGADFRWKLPITAKNNYALYGQFIAEDRNEDSLLLGDISVLLGGSTSGYSKKLNGSWRTYIEATDTSASTITNDRERNNITYNHSTYKDGYRHQGISMGHGIDSDSRMISIGTMLSRDNGDFWRVWAKHAKLNEDGKGINPIAPNGKQWSAIGLSLDKKFNKNIRLNLGTQFISEKDTGKKRHNDMEISTGFSFSF